jgi:hypothetical protein
LRRQLGDLKKNATLASLISPIDAEAERIQTGVTAANAGFTAVLGVVDSADRRPPVQAYELSEQTRGALDALSARWDALRNGALSALNHTLQENGLPAINLER